MCEHYAVSEELPALQELDLPQSTIVVKCQKQSKSKLVSATQLQRQVDHLPELSLTALQDQLLRAHSISTSQR